ncbi:MAG: M48 family metalloprotease [Saprospiraceae bacterium]
MLKHRITTLFLPLFLLLAVALFDTCATNPVTGKRQISFISEEQEIQMGKEYDPQVVAEFGLYPDEKLQNFISTKGLEMARISERPNLPWTFRVVDSPVINAFAVPGGFVYFTRGILAHFNNEAQFAGVLGHEIGHVTARHTVQQQSKQTLAQLGLVGGMIAVPGLAEQAQTAMQGMQLLFLKFGRDAESQSDELGVKYSTAIGYDAREMAGFFGTLDRLSGGAENRVPSFLSTHPDPANRQQRVGQLAAEAQAANPGVEFEVDRNEYLRMIEGIVYGEDPRQGFVENNAFYHPELKFQFGFPTNWTLINSPTQVQIVAPDQKAVIIMRLGQGSASQAAQTFASENQIQVVSSDNTTINGLPAAVVVGKAAQTNEQGQVQSVTAVQATFIEYGGNTYQLMGLTADADYNRFANSFSSTARSFARLTDQSKINRLPERIRIAKTTRATTLRNALAGEGIPNDRLEEFAILNGFKLTQEFPPNALFKVISGGTTGK